MYPPRRLRAVRLDPWERARAIDREVDDLSTCEATLRLELGRIASVFATTRGYHHLGFARRADYTKERLGISDAELRGLAHVSSKLADLPFLATAFQEGAISWTAVRLLVDVATAADEQRWLELARERTTRDLEREVEMARAGRGSAGATPPSSTEGVAADDSIDGEAPTRFRIRCSRPARVLWKRAVELARRMSGEEVPIWKAAEAIAAEGLSGASSASPEDLQAIVATLDRAATPREGLTRESSARTERRDVGDPSSARRAIFDPFAADASMRRIASKLRRLDADLGRLLAKLHEERVYRLGYASMKSYIADRLGMSLSKALALIALERRVRVSPELAEIYRDGGLSWARVMAILPVIERVHRRSAEQFPGESAAARWVERARTVTVRRLLLEVDWVLEREDLGFDGDDSSRLLPPPLDSALASHEVQMRAAESSVANQRRDATVAFTGPESVVVLLRTVIESFGGFEKLLLHVICEWSSQPRHRDPVFQRDGWRCAVPGCSSRRNLHDHHVRFRSRGGGNERDNRTSLCAWHHLHGVHAERVRVRGRAPHDLLWEIGLRTGARPPLAVFRGETYLAGNPTAPAL